MGRHADALRIYPTAIDAQRKCCDKVPNSEMMRELLSKMYYNFGQSLRATSKFDRRSSRFTVKKKVPPGTRLRGGSPA